MNYWNTIRTYKWNHEIQVEHFGENFQTIILDRDNTNKNVKQIKNWWSLPN